MTEEEFQLAVEIARLEQQYKIIVSKLHKLYEAQKTLKEVFGNDRSRLNTSI